jgi:hypothetical protein
MWTEVAGVDEFGDADLFIDLSAELMVAPPFDTAYILGGCGGQGHEFGLKGISYSAEYSPPFFAKVVAFVNDQEFDPVEAFGAVAFDVFEDGLVGDNGQRGRFSQVVGDQIFDSTEIIANPPGDLQPQNRFARSGRRHDVDALVFPVTVQIFQNPRLMGAPGGLEFQGV